MKKLFKNKKLGSLKSQFEMVLLTGALMLLVGFAVLLATPNSPLTKLALDLQAPGDTQTASWLSCIINQNCANNSLQVVALETDSPTTINAGESIQIRWVAYSWYQYSSNWYTSAICSVQQDQIDNGWGCAVTYVGAVGENIGVPYCGPSVNNSSRYQGCHYDYFTVSPTETTTYTLCSSGYNKCGSITITVNPVSGGGGGGPNPCPTLIENPWAYGLLLYSGATRKITQYGYNYCVTNYSQNHYYVPVGTQTELNYFLWNAIPLGVAVY